MKAKVSSCVVAVVALAAVGCGSTINGSDPAAPFASWDGFDMDRPIAQGSLSGTLTLEDGCIYVGDTIPIFPTESEWNDQTQELSHPETGTIKIGQEVELTGGLGTDSQADRIPDACDLSRKENPKEVLFVTTTFSQ